MAIIKCENLAIGYKPEIIQRYINFEVNDSNYIIVIGKNGVGKTTLLKTLVGLIPAIGGKYIIDKDIRENGIGYLPQHGITQHNFPTTVEEVVLSGRQNKIKFFYTEDDRVLANAKMHQVGILDLKNKGYSELSGGQQQRVLLARALCISDKLLILDEPTKGLDIYYQNEFYKILKRLNNNGTAILMISHDNNDTFKDATHILEVDNGVKLSTLEEYKRSHNDI